MTFRPSWREVAWGQCATPAAQIAMVVREFAANDTTLRFSRRCTGERAAAPYFASQDPVKTFEFAGAEQANSPASPPGAAGTCRKDEFLSAGYGSFLPCSDGNNSLCIRL